MSIPFLYSPFGALSFSEKPLTSPPVLTFSTPAPGAPLLFSIVLPHARHIPSLLELTPTEHRELAEILSTVSVKYDNLFLTSFAYSMGLHQRPVPRPLSTMTNGHGVGANGHTNGHVAEEEHDADSDDVAHMHFHFSPPLLRSASVRKFLVGYVAYAFFGSCDRICSDYFISFELLGEPQRDLTAEQAAARLRDCADVHYLAEQDRSP